MTTSAPGRGADPSPGPAPDLWDDALLAAAMIAVDPKGLVGVHVRARAGAVRERWLQALGGFAGPDLPVRRVPAGVCDARLTGGLDMARTLECGRPMVERGVLAAADGGFVVLSMAERLPASAASVIAMTLDDGIARIERDGLSLRHAARFALVALDEGIEDEEGLAPALADRLGLRIALDAIALRDSDRPAGPAAFASVAEARALLASVVVPQAMMEALCAAALAVAGPSIRATMHLTRAARAAAALRGRRTAEPEDAVTALRLVLGIRLSPPEERSAEAERQDSPEEEEIRPPEAPAAEEQDAPTADALEEMLVAATKASLPRHLLVALHAKAAAPGARGTTGKAGALRNRGTRGRAIGLSDRPPVPGARIDVPATLRQAAPWQRIRARQAGREEAAAGDAPAAGRLLIRASDFRYLRYRDKTGTTAIFAVDASGSAAVERLAETKGAIELLLSECYVRRDSVGLVAFRGRAAETLLEPTRSLVHAKRSLSALPGGGGTPLAGGILAALSMAAMATRKGQSVVAVFLTDGRGNVGLDGSTLRETVEADTARTARLYRSAGLRSILIDTAQRPQRRAVELARDLGAEYLALPRGRADAVAREVGARMEG